MGKQKNDYAYVEGVGLFKSREAAMIYDYVLAAEGGATVPVEWTRLRDAMFGELSFMEHDVFALVEIEVLNPALTEIAKRTGDRVEFELSRRAPGEEPLIHFIRHSA